MANNCLLSWVNHLDAAATTIATSSAVEGLGVRRLQEPQVRRRMRTAPGVSSVSLSIDLGAEKEVGVLAVLQPDDAGWIDEDGEAVGTMAAADTIRHRLGRRGAVLSLDFTAGSYREWQEGAAIGWGAGTETLYDSLYQGAVATTGPALSLDFTIGSYREWQADIGSGIVAGYGLHAHVLPAAVQARYWQADIAAPSLAAVPGYLDLGRLWVGPAWRPSNNFDFEWTDAWDDLSEVTEVRRSGLDFVDRGPRRRVLTFAFRALSEPEAKVAMKELGRLAGTSGQVLFIQEPGGPYQGYEAIIGRLVEVSPITQPNFALYERVFQIRQSL
ncbi:hypothetical protein [Azospirillum thermophilum]|uniref:Uncharacterized protein n=1 Tax=Azospirillum thermophilum TaxID=2202148 RepID=A0A2S2CKR0_9PROT|nr:hypothetical protein [Azospirillum thermophilum]AWK85019.1 hypothetical protein DEW08_01435 [Azospirillum thermophilum]